MSPHCYLNASMDETSKVHSKFIVDAFGVIGG